MRLRILHVFHHIFHYACGYRTRSENILRCQREHGLEPYVVTSSDHEGGMTLRDPDGVRILRTPPYRGPRGAAIRECCLMTELTWRVAAAIDEVQPDVVHAHSPVLVALPALAAARRRGRPFVYEVRDLWENASVDLGRFGSGSLRYRAARAADSYVLRGADAVTVICDSMRREIAGRIDDADRIFVAANGVDVERLRPESLERVQRLPHLPDRDVIGYIGMLQPYEGLTVLLDALPDILRRRPAAHVVITGDGNDEPRVRAYAEARGLGRHVTFTGRVPHDEVSRVYAACDVLAYPRYSTDTTRLTTPLKPLEAMALGKAVLGSDLPPMRELIQDGVTGLLFPAGDAAALASRCVNLLEDVGLRQQMGRAARAWVVQHRPWRTVVAAYDATYRTALARHPQPVVGAPVAGVQ